jgi:uncharacterized membrane protein YfcA
MDLDWPLLIKFSLGAVVGMAAGTKLSSIIPGDYLKRIFGWFIMVVAAYVIYKQFFL